MNRLTEQAIAKDLQKVTEFVKRYGKPYDPQNDNYKREPFASDVRAGKNSPIYNAHSYHTKVPPKGIEPFIKHYTEPGDITLDPFCGSGMTGIAALRNNRIPILIDLSPAATFIAENYCSSVDLSHFSRAAQRILNKAEPLVKWLYETKCRRCGGKAIIEYVIWSDEFKCPRCANSFLLWDVIITKEEMVKSTFDCPLCGKTLKKRQCVRLDSKPVRVNYSCKKCKRQEDTTDSFDMNRIREIERRWDKVYTKSMRPDRNDGFWPLTEDGHPLFFPDYPLPEGYNTRQPKKSHGVTHVNKFFTTRNLWILTWIWNKIQQIPILEIQLKLSWAFTSMLLNATKMYKYRSSRKGGIVAGTLYIPSINIELNVLRLFERKVFSNRAGILRVIKAFNLQSNLFIISTQSATDMGNIPDNSVDYVFTDPPFGGNLMYSELNFIWEAWLGSFTENREEAIINEVQGKGLSEYKELMARSFKEIYRVLKPGRWMTMVFHNSKGEVWQAIQEGLAESGFAIGMIGIFDKKQKSFKQVTSSGAVGYDVMVNCYKPKATVKNGIQRKTTEEAIIGFIADKLRGLPSTPCAERTDRMLHSKTIGFFMQQNKPLKKLSHKDFQEILKRNFREIDGYWYLPYQRPKIIGQKRLFGYISNEAEAIEWLEVFLKKPRKYGDIVPDFFRALGPNQLKKDLQQILEENFIEENGVWRAPTTAEKERLIKKVTNKTARLIDQFLKGTMEYTPNNTELCEWIEFCYNNGMYQEGAKLFQYVNENTIDPELFKKTKKVAEICKIKSWG